MEARHSRYWWTRLFRPYTSETKRFGKRLEWAFAGGRGGGRSRLNKTFRQPQSFPVWLNGVFRTWHVAWKIWRFVWLRWGETADVWLVFLCFFFWTIPQKSHLRSKKKPFSAGRDQKPPPANTIFCDYQLIPGSTVSKIVRSINAFCGNARFVDHFWFYTDDALLCFHCPSTYFPVEFTFRSSTSRWVLRVVWRMLSGRCETRVFP